MPHTSSHKTAELILQAAKKHFLEKGYDGTSINDVANDAKINKSLIYHHFGSKQDLWKAVKSQILEQTPDLDIKQANFRRQTLKEFLEAFVTFRFKVYASQPELSRLMTWQRLEVNSRALSGVGKKSLLNLEDEIVLLQQAGEIRADLNPEMVNYLITSCAANGFMDNITFLHSSKGREQYLKLLIDFLYRALTANPL